MSLQGNPPPVLSKAVSALPAGRRDAFLTHLHGGTSADFLSDWLKRAGVQCGATAIKDYRRREMQS